MDDQITVPIFAGHAHKSVLVNNVSGVKLYSWPTWSLNSLDFKKKKPPVCKRERTTKPRREPTARAPRRRAGSPHRSNNGGRRCRSTSGAISRGEVRRTRAPTARTDTAATPAADDCRRHGPAAADGRRSHWHYLTTLLPLPRAGPLRYI